MKQYEAVIQTLEQLGGQATLAELYHEVMKIEECTWKTKTPFASIRRIVQVRPEIFKVQPGLWALRSYQNSLGLSEHNGSAQPTPEVLAQGHSYYQGLLVIIGNLRGHGTFIPNQDKNRLFVNRPLRELRSFQETPIFSYPHLVKKSSTVDVTWYNVRQMPHSFFEVEHSTDVQNSLLKFYDLQDFHARMFIVADDRRRAEFDEKRQRSALDAIKDRVSFLGFDTLVKYYEFEMLKSERGLTL